MPARERDAMAIVHVRALLACDSVCTGATHRQIATAMFDGRSSPIAGSQIARSVRLLSEH
jgi:hypothetical protein